VPINTISRRVSFPLNSTSGTKLCSTSTTSASRHRSRISSASGLPMWIIVLSGIGNGRRVMTSRNSGVQSTKTVFILFYSSTLGISSAGFGARTLRDPGNPSNYAESLRLTVLRSRPRNGYPEPASPTGLAKLCLHRQDEIALAPAKWGQQDRQNPQGPLGNMAA
jgi:hypothetical protein